MTVENQPPQERRREKKEPKKSAKKESSTTIESPVRSRVRPAVLAGGIAIIVVCALAVAWLVNTSGNNIEVFAASKDLARGAVVQPGDLTTVKVPQGQPLPVTAKDLSGDIIGKTAVVDIPQGTLINSKNVSTDSGIPSGFSIVGVSLAAGQLPPYPLKNGDRVRVVDTPVSQGEPPKESPPTISATVISTTTDANGRTTVAVQVTKTKAPDLAARSATGRVALVLDSSKD